MSVPDHAAHLAETFLKTVYGDLRDTERRVVSGIARRVHITRDVNAAYDEKLTFGQRLADKVSKFGGSWTFITFSWCSCSSGRSSTRILADLVEARRRPIPSDNGRLPMRIDREISCERGQSHHVASVHMG